MSHRFRLRLWCCLISSTPSALACGDLFFSSDSGASTLRIDALAVQFVARPETLMIGDSSLVRIRVVNSANVDVTAFVDSIYWVADPIQVIALADAKMLGTSERYVRAVARGTGKIEVTAVYFKSASDPRVASPVTNVTVAVQ